MVHYYLYSQISILLIVYFDVHYYKNNISLIFRLFRKKSNSDIFFANQ